MEWLINNNEWVFSGIGVFALGIIYTFFKKSKKQKSINMKQNSGDNSSNIQVGGNFKQK
jgi:hypothetical protein